MKQPCTSCGGSLGDTDRFCPTCGTARDAAAPPAAGEQTSAWDRVLNRLREATRGEYVIVRQIGRGGMAAVFLAVDTALNRNVAIKVLSPALLMAEGMAERFRDEAITIARLDHPNIIAIYGVRRLDDLHYFVMKYVEGRALDYIIRNTGPLGVPVVRGIVAQVGPGLDHAHRHGVIHRDVKPANLLVESTGRVIVSDFGIAKVAQSQGLTQTGSMIGTAAYMSPEQCAGGVATKASDQYSLGIVIYELLTGRPPHTGTPLEIIQAHVYSEFSPLRSKRPDCSPQFERALHRMLAKDPAERWPSLQEAQAALGADVRANTEDVREKLASMAVPDPDVTQMLSAAAPEGGGSGASKRSPSTDPARIMIQNVPDELETGERTSLAGMVIDESGTTIERELEWSSTEPDVAAIEGDPPTLTGIGPGTARIRAAVRGTSVLADVGVRVVEARACTLELSATTLTVEVGEERRIVAVPRDRRGGSLTGNVSWTSADPAIAAVTSGGIVTGRAAGTTELTVEADEVRRVAAIRVQPARIASIQVTPANATITTGDSVRVEAMACDARGANLPDRPVTWSSRSPSVASVTADGTITGWTEGTAELIASCGGLTATVPVRVEVPAVVRLELDGVPDEIRPGTRFRLTARAVNARGEKSATEAAWKSSRSRIASVSADGIVETHRPGRATVVARLRDLEARVELTVMPAVKAAVPLVSAGPASPWVRRTGIGVGAAAIFAVSVLVVQTIRGTSDASPGLLPTGPDSAQITEGGGQPGTGGEGAESEATIGGQPGGPAGRSDTGGPGDGTDDNDASTGGPTPGRVIPIVDIDAPFREIAVGDSMRIDAGFRGGEPTAEERRLTWTSNDVTIAAVTGGGLVRGRAVGSVWIRAGNGVTADSVPVNVIARRVAVRSVAIAPDTPSVVVGESLSLSARALDADGRQLSDRSVAWASSNPQVAVVDASGVVTGRQQGSVRISAETETARASVTLRVTAPQPLQRPDEPVNPAPVPVRFASVSAGGGTCASTEIGPLLCWGFNAASRRQVGTGFTGIASGGDHQCGLRSGTALCWGRNESGQLGDGSTTNRSSPAPVSGNSRFVALAAGGAHTCGLDAQGAVWCWGANGSGQLGTGSTRGSLTPARVDESVQFTDISTGQAHTCAIERGGRAWCWGDGLAGELGNGMTQNWRKPVQVDGEHRFRAIAAGDGFTCALTDADRAMCWGDNRSGQLGDRRNNMRDEPRYVERIPAFQQITTGRHHACGVTSNGELHCWGSNEQGQLGNGTTAAASVPVRVEAPVRFTSVSAGNLHTCGLAETGTLYCWGDNSFGQIDPGGPASHTTPVPVRITG